MTLTRAHPAQFLVGKPASPSPKVCKCGLRGDVRDTKLYADYVRRRYRCSCGLKWSTYEVLVTDEDSGEE